jgi:hypothetical protein
MVVDGVVRDHAADGRKDVVFKSIGGSEIWKMGEDFWASAWLDQGDIARDAIDG